MWLLRLKKPKNRHEIFKNFEKNVSFIKKIDKICHMKKSKAYP